MQRRSWLCAWAIWLVTGGAQAQVTATDKAAAEALFDRGTALLREGKLEEACARLEQSQAIERGIGTMLYLADCYEKRGMSASAWALFREATSEAQAAGQLERAQAGRQRAERLERVLSKLTVDVPEAHRVPGLELFRNDAAIPPGVWGVSVPVDPGEQRIEARAPGYLTYTQLLVVEKGPGAWRLEVPALAPSAVAAASNQEQVQEPEQAPSAQPSAALDERAAPQASPASAEGATRKPISKLQLVGLAASGVGAVLTVVGGAYAIRALRKDNEADDLCRDGCDRKGKEVSDQAIAAGNIANVGFAGLALVAGGLVTYFVAPERATKVALSIDQRGAGLAVGGAF